jgi:cytochrome c oxidase subunit 2
VQSVAPTSEETTRGQVVFLRESCAGCHTIRGTTAAGKVGPDLTNFGSRSTIGAATVPNTRNYLSGWIADAQSFKPGNLMPPIPLEPADLDALVAYLESLK